MLTSFRVQNFKSYRDATLALAPLTVLIGANASGKSNVIEALRLLSWIAAGNKLGSIAHAVQGDGQPIRGTVQDLSFRGASRFQLTCHTTNPQWDEYTIHLRCQGDNELYIAGERLIGSGGGAPLLQVVDDLRRTGDVRVAYNNFARGGRKPQVVCNNQMSVLVQLQSRALFARHHGKSRQTIPRVASQYLAWMSNMVFLDPRPSLMRGYSFKTDRRLLSSGANLSGVLFGLCRRAPVRHRILNLVEALPEQDINAIDFIETPRNEAMVKLTETFGGNQTAYDATLLSDGTLRVLAIGATLLSAEKGSLVVVEEVDNGVHPSRAGLLLRHISEIAKRRNLRVLISSHNPALVDAIPEEAVADVVFCHRDGKTGASRLTRLADLPTYPQLVAQAPLGRLLTHGVIDQFVKEQPSPAERRRMALAWLDRLQNDAD